MATGLGLRSEVDRIRPFCVDAMPAGGDRPIGEAEHAAGIGEDEVVDRLGLERIERCFVIV